MGVQFDIRKDKLYPCFCEACLAGKAKSDMSEKDIRYCVGCQQSIELGYELEAEKSKHTKRYKPNIPIEKVAPVELPIGEEKTKMSTVNSDNARVDNFRARGRSTSYKKRPLPDDEIKQLNQQGMGAKAITGKLKREKGIIVSYKTIQRILSGERGGVTNGQL